MRERQEAAGQFSAKLGGLCCEVPQSLSGKGRAVPHHFSNSHWELHRSGYVDTMLTHAWLHVSRTLSSGAEMWWSLQDTQAEVWSSRARIKGFAVIPRWKSTGTA